MKKFIKWFLKYVDALNTLLLINVIALLIIEFGIPINDKTVNILIAIAAIVSTFFLYLAFRESKRGNDLKIFEPIFTQLEKQVVEKEILNKKELFGEDINDIGRVLNYSEEKLRKLHYKWFAYGLSLFFSHIKKNATYEEFLKQVGKEKKVILDEIFITDEAKTLSTILSKIDKVIIKVSSEYLDRYRLIESIHNSSLFKNQKLILISRIIALNEGYNNLVKLLIENKRTGHLLKEFFCFEIKLNVLYKWSTHFDESIINVSSSIERITDQYKG